MHDLLKKFIKSFVLCTRCQNPETSMGMQGNTLILKCAACGHSYPAPSTKLTKLILPDFVQGKKENDDENEDDDEENQKENQRKKPKKSTKVEKSTSSAAPVDISTELSLRDQTFVSSSIATLTVVDIEQQKRQEELRSQLKQPDHPIMELFDKLFPNTISVSLLENRENIDKLMVRRGEMGQFGILVGFNSLVFFIIFISSLRKISRNKRPESFERCSIFNQCAISKRCFRRLQNFVVG